MIQELDVSIPGGNDRLTANLLPSCLILWGGSDEVLTVIQATYLRCGYRGEVLAPLQLPLPSLRQTVSAQPSSLQGESMSS